MGNKPRTYRHSPETIEKIRNSNKGKVRSQEARKNISLAHIGKTPPNKGMVLLKLRGENHWNWKGGKRKRLGTRVEEKEWRISVFQRDSFTCQVCGQVGGSLEAHHIKSYAYYPEFRHDINNGVTLCKECHKMTNNYGHKAHKEGRKNFTS